MRAETGRRLRIAWAFAAVAAVLAAPGCAGKRPASKPHKDDKPPRAPLAMSIRGTQSLQQDENGRPLWKFNAAEVKFDEARLRAVVRNASVTAYEKGQPAIHLSCPALVAEGETRTLTASGGVQADSGVSGVRFSANRIVLDLRTNRVKASGGVKGVSPDGSFGAESLEADIRFRNIHLEGSPVVSGELRPAPQRMHGIGR